MALAALMTLMGASEAFASAHCFCKLSIHDNTNKTSCSGVIKDYGQLATYTGLGQQSDSNQTNCNTKCTSAAMPDNGSQALATAACNAGAGNGTIVRAWSAVGTKEYKSAQAIGTLKNIAAVRNCPQGGSIVGANCVITVAVTKKCPQGWAANSTNVDGGVTADGLCKKAVAGCNLSAPLPANGTQIAGYGFTWGNAVVQWGSAANGGAAIISCPAGYSVNGTNCVKTYPVTVVTPAQCKF